MLSMLANGEYSLTVTQTDRAGNISPALSGYMITVATSSGGGNNSGSSSGGGGGSSGSSRSANPKTNRGGNNTGRTPSPPQKLSTVFPPHSFTILS